MNFKANKWSDIIGNEDLKRVLKNMVIRHKSGLAKKEKPRLLVTGTSRSGKTESIELFTRVLMCQAIDPETLDPCQGSCDACVQKASRFGMSGLYSEFWSGGVEFIPVDCGLFSTLGSLVEKLDIREVYASRTRVYFLDEFQTLFRNKIDEALLKTVEQVNAYWFFATAKPDEIDEMFKNRVIEISTQLPGKLEFAKWLQDRSNEAGVHLNPQQILNLCRASNMVPGLALKQLSTAALLGPPREG